MKTRFHVFFLFSLIFTLAMVANARQVSLQTNSETDEKYVNMPVNGVDTLILGSETSFKVYDDVGAEYEYSSSAYGFLVIIAPDGKAMHVSGEISTEENCDFLTLVDGGDEGDTLLDRISGAYNIGTLSGITNVVSINFQTDGSVTNSGNC